MSKKLISTNTVLPREWSPNDIKTKAKFTTLMRENDMPTLKSLAPNSGAYMNEADPTDPDWKNNYFRSNYKKLLDIKHKWDSRDVFWCKPCVGHDEGWEVRDGPEDEYPVEWGIGQMGGRGGCVGRRRKSEQ